MLRVQRARGPARRPTIGFPATHFGENADVEGRLDRDGAWPSGRIRACLCAEKIVRGNLSKNLCDRQCQELLHAEMRAELQHEPLEIGK